MKKKSHIRKATQKEVLFVPRQVFLKDIIVPFQIKEKKGSYDKFLHLN